MILLVAVAAVLATYRLTLLVTADEITKPVRQKLRDRFVVTRMEPRGPVDHEIVTFEVDPVEPERWLSATCKCGQGWRSRPDADGEAGPDAKPFAFAHVAEHPVVYDEVVVHEPKLLYLLSCPWCVSMWLAWPVVWSAWCFGGRAWWFVPAAALSTSAATGALAQHAAP